MKAVAAVLGALAALGIARLLPGEGAGLLLRLAAATLVLLGPGLLAARALRQPPASAGLGWTLALGFAALALTFRTGSSLTLTTWLLAAAAAVLLPFAARGRFAAAPRSVWIGAAGIGLGIALWWVAVPAGGDALFHLARVRKLDDFGSLSLHAVNEFRDGGLHPGYAFPLWHAFLALVARLAGVDPAAVVEHEASVLAPLAFLVAYEAGWALFRSRAAALAVVAAQVAPIALAPGHGGAYRALALPATAGRQLLAVAVLALVFEAVRAPSARSVAVVAAAALGLALVHPTYAPFVAVPLGGFLVARVLLEPRDAWRPAITLAAVVAPAAGVALWLLPVVRETASHDPTAAVRAGAAHGLARYAGQLDIFSDGSYRLAPEVLGRSGAVAVAALVLVPVAALAWRRAFAAFVVGGSLAVLALVLVPDLFTRLSDAVSLSQARRAAGFVPLAFAFAAGVAVLARVLSWLVLPLALGLGIGLQLAYPGDFGYRLEEGGPALATWIAAFGGACALALVAVVRRPRLDEARGALVALAALLFVSPVAWHGFTRWSAPPSAGEALTPGLVAALRREVPKRSVVLSDPETSYRVAAFAPVYVVASPPAHVADTESNRSRERARDARRFMRTGDLAIAGRYGAEWLVVDRRRSNVRLHLRRVYADSRYTLYRL